MKLEALIGRFVSGDGIGPLGRKIIDATIEEKVRIKVDDGTMHWLDQCWLHHPDPEPLPRRILEITVNEFLILTLTIRAPR